tara:strand:+ start:319 stop:780 length:462 start_codon:yes stop_codon:yes gene_type:complete
MADTSLNENRLGLLIWQTSNVWQARLRFLLKDYNLSLNEYLILETIYKLKPTNNTISQVDISTNSSIDTAVISVKLKNLESKNLISKLASFNNRSNRLILSEKGNKLINSIIKIIEIEESKIFDKLNEETFNFTNSLKLILGKKIRIKAKNYE